MEDKIYFMPGDVVTLKQDIPYKPIMLVVKKETMTYRPSKDLCGKLDPSEDTKDPYFKGMRCRWFTTEGLLQEAIFNTKDLCKVEFPEILK